MYSVPKELDVWERGEGRSVWKQHLSLFQLFQLFQMAATSSSSRSISGWEVGGGGRSRLPLFPPHPTNPSPPLLSISGSTPSKHVTAPLLWLAITAALSPPITLKYCTKMVSCWPGQLSRSPASFSFVVVDKRTRAKACRRECRTVCACAADSV